MPTLPQDALVLTASQPPSPLIQLGRWITSFPGMLAAILVAKVVWTCRDRIADPDLWWHLKNAQYLWTTGHFPNFDSYSFTAAGSPWLNHEWLSELFYYGAYRALGLQGVFLLFTAVLLVIMLTLFQCALKASGEPFAAGIVTVGGGLLAMVGFSPRTQLFGWLCFLGIYVILLRLRAGRRAPLWLVPVLFCVWINCHGSWPLGLAVYAIVVGCGLLQRDVGHLAAAPWSPPQLRRLVLTGLASLAAMTITPFGYRLLAYPFDLLFRQSVGVANVGEWASVDFNDARGHQVLLILALILYLAFAGRNRWRLDEAALTGLVLFCGLTHIRFLLFAGMVLPPLLVGQLGRLSSYNPQHERRLINSVFVAGAAAFVFFGYPTESMLQGQNAALFPVDCIQFLKAHPQPGRIFNSFDMGGFLEWNLPQVPVFIDSRSDIFDYKGVLRDYLAITGAIHSQELLDRYAVSYVVYPKDTPLAYLLVSNGRWEGIYEGGQSIILRRQRAPLSETVPAAGKSGP